MGFFDYVQYFDQAEIESNRIESNRIESIQNKALRSIYFIESEFNLVSIDGKDIRHCSGRNVKSVNVVVNHALRGSYIVDSEQRRSVMFLLEMERIIIRRYVSFLLEQAT